MNQLIINGMLFMGQATGKAGNLDAALSKAAGVLGKIAFLYAVVMVMSGAMKVRGGQTEEAKLSIISAVIAAAAFIIVQSIFSGVGMQINIQPQFGA